MPRLKKSVGRYRLTVPINDEFRRWLLYELANSKQWNPKQLDYNSLGGMGRWKFTMHTAEGAEVWSIQSNGTDLVVKSELPKFELWKGLIFDMGSARMILNGNTDDVRRNLDQ